MTIFKDLGKGFYTLLFVAPLFWIVPTMVEGLQHLVEVQLGFFTVGDGVKGNTETAIRLTFGFFKVMSILVPVLLILKLSGNDWDKSKLFPLVNLEKKTIVITAITILGLLIFLGFFSEPFTRWLTGLIKIPEDMVPFTPLLVLLALVAIFRAPITRSMLTIAGVKLEGKLSVKSYGYELLNIIYLTVLVAGPMYLHYQIDGWARGTDGWELFGLLTLDSLLVGLMVLLIGLAMRLAIVSVYSRDLKAGIA
ncbi:hypothetical protein [Kangiella shandongensis]|uniref:hypothetical protein n=1 Tax=Kangiella shandongensis TaxID=2763258 RepID=UPI001CBCD3D3|nr:hypothetical protein [Kangiella shandongensis]